MTVIVAALDVGCAWIGSDTMAVNNGTKMPNGPKWLVSGKWALGHAGDKFIFNMLHAHKSELIGQDAWSLAVQIRGFFQDYGVAGDGEMGPQSYDQNMILVNPSGIWSISPCLSVIEVPDGEVWADGSGRCYALGAAHACSGDQRSKVRAALSAALRYEHGCGGDPWIDRLEV